MAISARLTLPLVLAFGIGFVATGALIRSRARPASPPTLELQTVPKGAQVFLSSGPGDRMVLGPTPFSGPLPLEPGAISVPLEIVATGWRTERVIVPIVDGVARANVDLVRASAPSGPTAAPPPSPPVGAGPTGAGPAPPSTP